MITYHALDVKRPGVGGTFVQSSSSSDISYQFTDVGQARATPALFLGVDTEIVAIQDASAYLVNHRRSIYANIIDYHSAFWIRDQDAIFVGSKVFVRASLREKYVYIVSDTDWFGWEDDLLGEDFVALEGRVGDHVERGESYRENYKWETLIKVD